MVAPLETKERLRLVSISRVAELLRMDRATVAARLANANVKPAGMRDGYPVYDGRQAIEAALGPVLGSDPDTTDPKKLKPMERRAWYQSERERLALETDAKQLIPAAEVHEQMAEMARTFVQFLDTLPDVLERLVHMRPDQIEEMHKVIYAERQRFYEMTEREESDD